MPNPIKYTTGTETLALKKGNFYIATGDVGKGPSDTTGYYQGLSPSEGGYVIYLNKEGAPGGLSYHSATNDSELISFTNSLANTSFTSATQCLNYYATQTDKVCVNRDYEGIVTNGLVLNVDAGFTPSYSRSGTTWYDLSLSGNNGTLTNGPTFNSSNGGGIVFDGVDDYVPTPNPISNNSDFTINFWMYYLGGNSTVGLISTWNTSWQGVGISFSNFNNNNVWSLRSWANNGAGGGMNWGVLDNLKNVWSNITLTFTNSNGTQRGYINGMFQNSESNKNNLNHDTTLQIARGGLSDSQQLQLYPYVNTILSNLQIYNRALTAAEVSQNYNAQKGRFGL
jgi:hypothetical protein